jgi:predicted ArsR family transcriptional regulator
MRDIPGVLLTMLRHSPAALTTPQITARAGVSSEVARRHLGDLERAGRVGRIAGTPQRWYWRADVENAA